MKKIQDTFFLIFVIIFLICCILSFVAPFVHGVNFISCLFFVAFTSVLGGPLLLISSGLAKCIPTFIGNIVGILCGCFTVFLVIGWTSSLFDGNYPIKDMGREMREYESYLSEQNINK